MIYFCALTIYQTCLTAVVHPDTGSRPGSIRMCPQDSKSVSCKPLSTGTTLRPKETRADRGHWRRKKKKRETLEEDVSCPSGCVCSFLSPDVPDVNCLDHISPCEVLDARDDAAYCTTKDPHSSSTDMSSVARSSENSLFPVNYSRAINDDSCGNVWNRVGRIFKHQKFAPDFGKYHMSHRLQDFVTTRNLHQINFLRFLFCALIVLCVLRPSHASDSGHGAWLSTAMDPITSRPVLPSSATTIFSPVDSSMAANTSTPDLVTYTTTMPIDWGLSSNLTSRNKTDILLGYITTLTYEKNVELADGRKISGAMTHAVDVINKDPSILPDYHLHYVLGDNRGTELHSLDVLTGEMLSYIHCTLS